MNKELGTWKSVDHLALESDISHQIQTAMPDTTTPDPSKSTSSAEYFTSVTSRLTAAISKLPPSAVIAPAALISKSAISVQRLATSFDCLGRRGYFPDLALRCNTYYYCDGSGKALTFQCPLDLAFDKQEQACVYPHKTACVAPVENGLNADTKRHHDGGFQQQSDGNLDTSYSQSYPQQSDAYVPQEVPTGMASSPSPEFTAPPFESGQQSWLQHTLPSGFPATVQTSFSSGMGGPEQQSFVDPQQQQQQPLAFSGMMIMYCVNRSLYKKLFGVFIVIGRCFWLAWRSGR